MAEIHVQAKKKTGSAWVWIIVGVILIAAIVFFMWRSNQTKKTNTTSQPASTSQIKTTNSEQIVFYS